MTSDSDSWRNGSYQVGIVRKVCHLNWASAAEAEQGEDVQKPEKVLVVYVQLCENYMISYSRTTLLLIQVPPLNVQQSRD